MKRQVINEFLGRILPKSIAALDRELKDSKLKPEYFFDEISQDKKKMLPEGLIKLGILHLTGLGVSQNKERAETLFKEAAKEGSAEAKFYLGRMYFEVGDFAKAREWWQSAAEESHDEAQYYLGQLYAKNLVFAPNHNDAAYWLNKSAEKGDPHIQYLVGWGFQHGHGVEKNDFLAERWYRKSAEYGHPHARAELIRWYQKSADEGNAIALAKLGDLYSKGSLVHKNASLAVECYGRSADQGNAYAQLRMAECFEEGFGVKKNPEESLVWLKKSAANGNADAQLKLGLYFKKAQGVDQADDQAIEWFEKSAKKGDIDAQCLLGLMYLKKNNYTKAFYWFKESAYQGNAYALLRVAECYEKGLGVEINPEKALAFFQLSAEKGNANAQFRLGVHFKNAQGDDQADEQAIQWFEKSAKQGHIDAQCFLGFMYYKKNNFDKAFHWFNEAAMRGNADAQFNIGLLYYHGKGVVGDKKRAHEYFEKSADNRDPHILYLIGLNILPQKYWDDIENTREASIWFRRAAMKGDKDAKIWIEKLKQGMDDYDKLYNDFVIVFNVAMAIENDKAVKKLIRKWPDQFFSALLQDVYLSNEQRRHYAKMIDMSKLDINKLDVNLAIMAYDGLGLFYNKSPKLADDIIKILKAAIEKDEILDEEQLGKAQFILAHLTFNKDRADVPEWQQHFNQAFERDKTGDVIDEGTRQLMLKGKLKELADELKALPWKSVTNEEGVPPVVVTMIIEQLETMSKLQNLVTEASVLEKLKALVAARNPNADSDDKITEDFYIQVMSVETLESFRDAITTTGNKLQPPSEGHGSTFNM